MRKNENLQFKSVKAATRYLSARGWRCSDKSIYRHIQQQKISKPPWTDEQLNLYSAEFLNPMVDFKPTKKGTKALQGPAAELIEARKAKIEVETESKRFELQIKKGTYIEKTIIDTAIAERALIFRSDLENLARGHSGEMVRLCNGDDLMTPDIIQFWLEHIETMLARYSGSTNL